MLVNFSLEQTNYVWNEKAIKSNAVDFLRSTNNKIKLIQDIWKVAQGHHEKSNGKEYLLSIEKASHMAKASKKEIKALNNSVKQLLNTIDENQENLEQRKQLAQISEIAHGGKKICNTILKNAESLTLLRKEFKINHESCLRMLAPLFISSVQSDRSVLHSLILCIFTVSVVVSARCLISAFHEQLQEDKIIKKNADYMAIASSKFEQALHQIKVNS